MPISHQETKEAHVLEVMAHYSIAVLLGFVFIKRTSLEGMTVNLLVVTVLYYGKYQIKRGHKGNNITSNKKIS